jgi:hypothetical protein
VEKIQKPKTLENQRKVFNMKMYKSIAFLTIFLVVGLFQAFAGNQQDLPLPHKVAGQHVYLWSSKYELLKPDEVASLEWQLAVFEKKTGVDIDVFACVGEGRNLVQINELIAKVSGNFAPYDNQKKVFFFFGFAIEDEKIKDGWTCFYDPNKLDVDPRLVRDENQKRLDALPEAQRNMVITRVMTGVISWADVWQQSQTAHKGLVSN